MAEDTMPGAAQSPGGSQNTTNLNSPQHNGIGDMHVTYNAEREDHFRNGEKALVTRQYPRVVAEFEAYLSTYREDEDPQDVESLVKQAKAHTYIALGLLNGDPPSNRAPEEIYRVGHQLDMALGCAKRAGGADPVLALAGALWRLVEEDYYKSARMSAPPLESGDGPPPDVVDQLDDAGVQLLLEHTTSGQTETRRALTQRAGTLAVHAPQAAASAQPPHQDPERAEKVRKYFTRTPRTVEPTAHVVAFAGTAALVVLGAVIHGFALVLFLGFAIWTFRIGLRKQKAFREYQRAYDAAEPKPSDAQMDEWLRQDVEYIKSRAPERLHINTNLQTEGKGGQLIFPAQIIVSVHEGRFGNETTWVARGKDGQLRASRYEVLILFLTDKYISTYGGLLDFKTGDLVVDAQHEYHYRDVVKVSSISVPVERSMEQLVRFALDDPDAPQTISYRQQFTLTLVAGTPVTMTTGYNGPKATTGEVAWADNAHALPIIQRMVRARKNAAVN